MKGRLVRIYLSEGHGQLQNLVQWLHDQGHVRGVSVFRAVEGYGGSGKIHGASLIDLSLNQGLVLEFFDQADKVSATLAVLRDQVDPQHIVSWPIEIH